jgi:hypothetical protein
MDNIEQSNAVVAFIDILGFKEIVEANRKRKDNAILNSIQTALSDSYRNTVLLMHSMLPMYGETAEDKERLSNKLKYRLFSDNLFVAFEYEDDLEYELAVYWVLNIAMSYQRKLLQSNIYVRGGIAIGQCYCNEHVIFSDALIRAYELESKIAKYPRIVVDNNVLKLLNKVDREHIFRRTLKKYLVKDWVGIVFLDPFKMMESVESLLGDIARVVKTPDDEKYVKSVMSNVVAHAQKDTTIDFLDEDLNDHVYEDVKRAIKKHRKNPLIQEKYLWLKEFIGWNGDYVRNIEFKFLYP